MTEGQVSNLNIGERVTQNLFHGVYTNRDVVSKDQLYDRLKTLFDIDDLEITKWDNEIELVQNIANQWNTIEDDSEAREVLRTLVLRSDAEYISNQLENLKSKELVGKIDLDGDFLTELIDRNEEFPTEGSVEPILQFNLLLEQWQEKILYSQDTNSEELLFNMRLNDIARNLKVIGIDNEDKRISGLNFQEHIRSGQDTFRRVLTELVQGFRQKLFGEDINEFDQLEKARQELIVLRQLKDMGLLSILIRFMNMKQNHLIVFTEIGDKTNTDIFLESLNYEIEENSNDIVKLELKPQADIINIVNQKYKLLDEEDQQAFLKLIDQDILSAGCPAYPNLSNGSYLTKIYEKLIDSLDFQIQFAEQKAA
jgi:hypothetical protein